MDKLTIKDVKKKYGPRFVVNGVSIEVNQGEIVGLLGKNGAGKTTTFYMAVGLVRPTSGNVFFNDKEITRKPMYLRAREGIGYLAQEPSIFRQLSVEENLMVILEHLPLNSQERKARLEELLERFHVDHVRKQSGASLSGGERRRVEIARALCGRPSFILLDEPFAGVDPIAVRDIQKIVSELKEMGLGVLITDHNVRETLAIVDRAYIMDEGKILVSGSAHQVAEDPIARKAYLGETFQLDTYNQEILKQRQERAYPVQRGEVLPTGDLKGELDSARGEMQRLQIKIKFLEQQLKDLPLP